MNRLPEKEEEEEWEVLGITIPGKHEYPDISMIYFHIRAERLNTFRTVKRAKSTKGTKLLLLVINNIGSWEALRTKGNTHKNKRSKITKVSEMLNPDMTQRPNQSHSLKLIRNEQHFEGNKVRHEVDVTSSVYRGLCQIPDKVRATEGLAIKPWDPACLSHSLSPYNLGTSLQIPQDQERVEAKR